MMELDPSCEGHPKHAAWVARVEELETEGLTRSDAQGVADVEFREEQKPCWT